MEKCPYCNDSTGYYTYAVVSGKAKCSFTWDGNSGDSTDMHDGISYRDLKTKRCLNCNKVIREKK